MKTILLVFLVCVAVIVTGVYLHGRKKERDRLIEEAVALCDDPNCPVGEEIVRAGLRGKSAESIKVRLEGMRMCLEMKERLKNDPEFAAMTVPGDIQISADLTVSPDLSYFDKDGRPK